MKAVKYILDDYDVALVGPEEAVGQFRGELHHLRRIAAALDQRDEVERELSTARLMLATYVADRCSTSARPK